MSDPKIEQELYVEKDESGDLSEYWRIVIGRKWVILFLTVSAALFAAVYYSMMPNRYSATVKILLLATSYADFSAASGFVWSVL